MYHAKLKPPYKLWLKFPSRSLSLQQHQQQKKLEKLTRKTKQQNLQQIRCREFLAWFSFATKYKTNWEQLRWQINKRHTHT